MAFPVDPTTRPAVLANTANGRLPPGVLVDTPGLAGGATVRLVAVAARAWRALAAAALAAGHTLKPTSAGDSYRSYDQQVALFKARYSTTRLAGRPTKVWNGQTWWQRPNTAIAAVPSTSNHGWGLAVDVGEERDGDVAAEPLDNATLQWLLANERRYGFSHELQSEPWHIRYNAGDAIPAAVLAFERGGSPQTGDDDMPPKFWRLPNGACGNTNGPWRYSFQKVEDLDAALAIWGLDRKALVAIVPERLAAYGQESNGVGGPAPVVLTAEQLAELSDDLADAVEHEIRDAVADLGEGGAAKVRADAPE